MPAQIRYSPNNDIVEIVTPEGTSLVDYDLTDPLLICADDEDPSKPVYLACIGENDSGLEVNTVYRLVQVETEVERDCVDLLEEETAS